jgi:malate dehydrogenase (oxaloacetate-decarboxylating)(NADP+)
MPFYSRGCYVCIEDRGNFVAVLRDYAAAHLAQRADGTYECDCIVFSDGGRILGLGDLGAWGMGIPIGKLDLYTVCGGVDPHKTMPVIIDAGIFDASGNTAKLEIRDHPSYTGCKKDRVTHKSEAGTVVNTPYYGEGNMIEEFMSAAVTVFGDRVLLQASRRALVLCCVDWSVAVTTMDVRVFSFCVSSRTSTRTTRSRCSPISARSS